MLINWIRHTKSKSHLFLYTKSPFWICVLVLWIHKGYCVVNSWCEMFVLKLSGIQMYIKQIIYLNITSWLRCIYSNRIRFNNLHWWTAWRPKILNNKVIWKFLSLDLISERQLKYDKYFLLSEYLYQYFSFTVLNIEIQLSYFSIFQSILMKRNKIPFIQNHIFKHL